MSSSESGESESVSAFGLPPPQPGRRVEQLGAGGSDDEDRHPARPVDEVVDEVEKGIVCPVQVLEHEDERPLLGERLEEAPPSGEGLVRPLGPVSPGVSRPTSSRRWPSSQCASAGSATAAATASRSLCLGPLGIVGLEHARLRLHHLAERPQAHSFAVRQRAALPPQRQLRLMVDPLEELPDEAALADPGDADERDELGLALSARAVQRADQRLELVRSRPTRDVPPSWRTSTPKPAFASSASQTATGSVFPFASIGAALAIVDRALGRSVGRVVDEDRADRRGGLQARCGVDHVARSHALARLGSGPERDQRLAGGDPDPHLELALLGERVADRERGAHGPLGIVLVRDRGAEHRHDRVADELLDGAAVPLELGAQARVVRLQEPRTSSGSIRSARAVKPTRSQKRQVTTLRSSRAGAVRVRAAWRTRAKTRVVRVLAPQLGQIFTRGG